jgi:chromosome partitioning protein
MKFVNSETHKLCISEKIENSFDSWRIQMSVIISTLNQKGGVGKTTNTLNVAVQLARNGAKVLMIDMDVNQGSLTKSILGDISEDGGLGIMNLLATPVSLQECIYETKVDNLFIVPSEEKINGMELNIEHVLFSKPAPQTILRDKLSCPLAEQFDYIMIDNGPNLNQVTINSLVASDYFLVSFTPADMSIDGMKKLFHASQAIMSTLNSNLKLLGIVLCMVDKREKISKECRENLTAMVGDFVFNTEISVNARFKTLRRGMNSIFDVAKIGKKRHARNSKSAKQYEELAFEIVERIAANDIETQVEGASV